MPARSEKPKADSLYWQVEQACRALQVATALSHAKRGNKVVLMTGRKLTDPEIVLLESENVEVIDGNQR